MRKRTFAWILLFGMCTSTAAVLPATAKALYQDRDDARRERDRDQRYVGNEAYEQGRRDGMEDHMNHRHKRKMNKKQWRNKDERNAYKRGYDEAYKGDRDRH